MDFLNMDLPPKEEESEIEEAKHQSNVNKVLTNNGIDPLEID